MWKKKNDNIRAVQEWFSNMVTYEGEPYVIDYEQAAAVVDNSLNTIVVARAGSGKTRTIVAKIVYLVAKRGVRPDEIMAFVFNANAAIEINDRLSKMMVAGEPIMGIRGSDNENNEEVRIASTFHAFARKIVYKMSKGERRYGKILAREKDDFVLLVVREILNENIWGEKLWRFMRGEWAEEAKKVKLNDEEVVGFTEMMTTFINRAQQKFLGGEETLAEYAGKYLAKNEVSERERLFIDLGVECFRRYHWYLLDREARECLCMRWNETRLMEYGTDFNLIVSWASKLIGSGRKEIMDWLGNKKHLLIDEYQDFSQLFLAAVEAIRSVAVQVRLFVVGDDWQAINRFAGSDVEYFRNFEKYFGEGFRRYEVSTNYRCDRAIVETARKFMQKSMGEKGSFGAFSRKFGEVIVIDPRETEVGYALVPYDLRVSVRDRILREATERMNHVMVKKSMVMYLKTVIQIIEKNIDAKEILILHRNNETNIGGVGLMGFGEGLRWGLDRLGILRYDLFDKKVKIMTIHKSKGLEAEVVIILEANEGVIPKTHPDTVLYGLFGETEEVALSDQKRLFYVAMTRAKRRLYILSEGGGFMKYLGGGMEGPG